ncbi:hypothetical protein [Micromonospora mirobrigensis]|uniref:Uncharacterized protein n=1 Tax=Micromonospora mirobrigensis TaxID=262898 RepID=A0A1C4VJA8_9ACTN|nr:hypothetical protein [Micromonospora mirobrigensis]SCE84038.1 hypothetical protein GA0070564_1011250 [Micromonospora mirobrigensis]
MAAYAAGPRTPGGAAVALRRLAAALVALAWAMLGYGLFPLLSPPDRRAWDDLEAGGRLAVNLTVHLPYLALTLPVAVVVVLGLRRTPVPLAPLVVAVAVVALFGCWVTAQGLLFAAQPRLAASLITSLIADTAAAAALAAAWTTADRPTTTTR